MPISAAVNRRLFTSSPARRYGGREDLEIMVFLNCRLSLTSCRLNLQHEATKARRGYGLPYRPERRLVTTEAARARVAAGFRRVDQRHLTGSKNGFELLKEDRQVLSLRNRGLWPSEIASILGIRVQSVYYRLERLAKGGFTFPPPTAPRPIPHRKVTDDELLGDG
jgi:hypothetical protein